MVIYKNEPPEVQFAKTLADETRQEIMRLCCCRWMSVGEITDLIGVAQPTISHHLAILRQMGLVNVRQEGRQTYYTLDQEQMVACCGRLMLTFAPEEPATQDLADYINPEP